MMVALAVEKAFGEAAYLQAESGVAFDVVEGWK